MLDESEFDDVPQPGEVAPGEGPPPSPGPRKADSREYRLLKAHKRRQWQAEDAPCHYCGRPIRWDLPHTEDLSFRYAHIQPVRLRPELELDPKNGAPAHNICNRMDVAATGAPAGASLKWPGDENLSPRALATRPDHWKPGDPPYSESLGWPTEWW